MNEHEDIHIHRERPEDDEERTRVIVTTPIPRYIQRQMDQRTTEFLSNEKEKLDPRLQTYVEGGYKQGRRIRDPRTPTDKEMGRWSG